MTTRKNHRDKLEQNATSHIQPEQDDGNKEYKLKLTNHSEHCIEQMATQMRFRMDEGQGECVYTLGVTDNGGVIGLTEEEYKESHDVLQQTCNRNNYVMTLLAEQSVDKSRKMYEFLIREYNPTKYIDIKVACAGNVDSGKTTMLGVLLSGKNDDGRGNARLSVFNFAHEVKSGKTSSVAQHILGFDEHGEIVNHDEHFGRKKTWPDIVKNSSKIVTFFDLCGHEPYLKTTIMGLTSQFPDVVFILVGANMGITRMTKEHMFLCLTLDIPFAIIITKIDLCGNRQKIMKETVQNVKKLLKLPGVRRIPCDVETEEDVVLAAKNINSFSTTPMFYVSNVTGEGIDFVKQFLNIFIKRPRTIKNENNIEYHIEQTFQVPGIGIVVGGQLLQGTIRTGDKLLLGPNNGGYKTVQVRSIHVKRVAVDEAESGRYVCLALSKIDRQQIHRGNVLLSTVDNHYQVQEFEAEISVLKSHSTTIKPGYEPVLHTCAIRQTARITEIRDKVCNRKGKQYDDNVLRTGDRANVRFRFCYKPEYLKKDFRLLLAEGRVKVIGKVLGVTKEDCRVEK
uniref:Tr-type G domain-containing protein n=1 Tax=viral metagenome TaxID=1070528 RepID=A0A6C0EJX2_9ZZZZ